MQDNGMALQDGWRQQWDMAAVALETDAENLANPMAVLAGTTFLERLRPDHNQFISGRRGTGKTHLLRCLSTSLRSSFDATGEAFPISVNGRLLSARANVMGVAPPAAALSLYVEHMAEIAEELRRQIAAEFSPAWWQRWWAANDAEKRAKQAGQIAGTLSELLREGEVRLLPEGEASLKAVTIAEAFRGAGVGGNISLNVLEPSKVGLKLHAESEAKRSRDLKRTSSQLVKGEVILPYREVAKELRGLLDLLGKPNAPRPRLVLLFDEWSALDKDMAVQPLLAEMLKKTLWAITRACVKIAGIVGRTRLAIPATVHQPTLVGFERPDDISGDVDLDLPGFVGADPEQLITFFLAMLQKHMATHLEWVKQMSSDTFSSHVRKEIFAEPILGFGELCAASSCVPRDFLYLFRQATAHQRESGAAKIDLAHIRRAAKDLYSDKRQNFPKWNAPEMALLKRIYKTIVAPEESYFFLIREDLADQPLCTLLYAGRLIHRLPAEFYDDQTHDSYVFFLMDYAALSQLRRMQQTYAVLSGAYRLLSAVSGMAVPRVYTPEEDAVSVIGDITEAFAKVRYGGQIDTDPRKLVVPADLFVSSLTPTSEIDTDSATRQKRARRTRRE